MIRVLAFLFAMSGAAWAVQPDEVLDDPALEQRAREISKGLRCLVCRNESIDESNADLARDLRLLVRERLSEGDSDAQVVDFVVARYGEYVLLKPQNTGANLILWFAGPALLVSGLAISVLYLRRRRPNAGGDELTDEEKQTLAKLLDD